jgi:hypothetical protein
MLICRKYVQDGIELREIRVSAHTLSKIKEHSFLIAECTRQASGLSREFCRLRRVVGGCAVEDVAVGCHPDGVLIERTPLPGIFADGSGCSAEKTGMAGGFR